MKNLLKINLIIFLSFSFFNLQALELKFKNLNKLSLNDIQSLSSLDIYDNDIDIENLNLLIKELYESELIYNISYSISKDIATISIEESKIIKSIYFNGNVKFNDDILSKTTDILEDSLINKSKINNNINKLRSLYFSEGFDSVSITASTEKFSESQVNLIFYINEGPQSKISNINFYGNSFFSDRYLRNIIKSKDLGPFSIFSSGSNFNKELFDFDTSLIINEYKGNGFFDVNIIYKINDNFLNSYNLDFYIH